MRWVTHIAYTGKQEMHTKCWLVSHKEKNLGIPGIKWRTILNLILEEQADDDVNWFKTGLGWDQIPCICDYGDELSGSIAIEFLDHLNTYELLKDDPVPWSCFRWLLLPFLFLRGEIK
jgi:hypothetical protein